MARKKLSLSAILISGAVGGALALLFAPKTGKELRKDVKNGIDEYSHKTAILKNKVISDAKNKSDGILKRAENILTKARSYTSGTYQNSLSKIEREINGLKSALNASINSYKGKPNNGYSTAPSENRDFTQYENETLPKNLGMGRRN